MADKPHNTDMGAPKHEDGRSHDSGSDELKQRLDSLQGKLFEHERDAKQARKAEGGNANGYAQAFRLSSEFIAGIVAGAGIGYVLDMAAGTGPWGLIIFLLLGFVAGILNVLRSAGYVSQQDRRIRK